VLDFEVVLMPLLKFLRSLIPALRILEIRTISAVQSALVLGQFEYDNCKGSRSSVAYFFKQSSKALYPFLFGTYNELNMTARPS